MVKKSDKNLIVGLDIGTSKVVAIVGEMITPGEIEIVGIGSCRSRGLKKRLLTSSPQLPMTYSIGSHRSQTMPVPLMSIER